MQNIATSSPTHSASSQWRDYSVEFGRGVLDTAMPTAAFAAAGLVMVIVPGTHIHRIPLNEVVPFAAATLAPLALGTACMKAEEVAEPVKSHPVVRNIGRAFPALAAAAAAVVAFNVVSAPAASPEKVAGNAQVKPVQLTIR